MTTSTITSFLLADDDRDDREMFSEALAALDPKIICDGVEDGREALKFLSTSKIFPNIIFVDINMPGMDGWELLRKLKSDTHYLDIPVIVYSTSSRMKDRNTAMDLGAVCFVTKPDNFILMKSMLKAVVDSLERKAVNGMCEQIQAVLTQRLRN
ncbi:MAG TPA: response regulator [Cyclobacteriaceae bacterium]